MASINSKGTSPLLVWYPASSILLCEVACAFRHPQRHLAFVHHSQLTPAPPLPCLPPPGTSGVVRRGLLRQLPGGAASGTGGVGAIAEGEGSGESEEGGVGWVPVAVKLLNSPPGDQNAHSHKKHLRTLVQVRRDNGFVGAGRALHMPCTP